MKRKREKATGISFEPLPQQCCSKQCFKWSFLAGLRQEISKNGKKEMTTNRTCQFYIRAIEGFLYE